MVITLLLYVLYGSQEQAANFSLYNIRRIHFISIVVGSTGWGANVSSASSQWISGQVATLPRIRVDVLIWILIHGPMMLFASSMKSSAGLPCFQELIMRKAWGKLYLRVGTKEVLMWWVWRASLSGLKVFTIWEFEYSRQNRYTGHVLCFGKSQHSVNVFLK